MEWRQFGDYFVSEDGRMRDAKGQELSPVFEATGYLRYNFDGQCHLAHRLVAHLWLGLDLEDRRLQVDHKDDDRVNCHYTNLQIVTAGQNKKLATARAYPNDDVVRKTCRKCLSVKSREEFHCKGNSSYCKTCTSIVNRIRWLEKRKTRVNFPRSENT